jgi:hypothetical protein
MASLVRETRRQSAEAFSIARDEDQIMAAPCQPIGIDRADTGRGAGYQRYTFRIQSHRRSVPKVEIGVVTLGENCLLAPSNG